MTKNDIHAIAIVSWNGFSFTLAMVGIRVRDRRLKATLGKAEVSTKNAGLGLGCSV
ncbi:MAG: hypothetical protein AAGB13_00245 [Cyanobacteria bacterium P01_F01_bin.33]